MGPCASASSALARLAPLALAAVCAAALLTWPVRARAQDFAQPNADQPG